MTKDFVVLILIILVAFSSQKYHACDDATATINSVIDNGDGTFTISIDFCPEFNGLEGNPDWFGFTFSGGTFTSIASATPATVSTTSGDDYNQSLLSGNTEVRWTTGSIFTAHTGTNLCFTAEIITNGNPGQVDVHYHDTYGPSCEETIVFPAPCAISGIAATPSACDPITNTYSVDITVTYANEPASGTIDINGETFAITGSPQTETITGLTANGSSQDITAVFSADPACTFTETGAYTAPADCTPSCNISAISATPSACDPATNTYSVDVTVTYVNQPGSGTLNVNGQTFAITGSPQTETITGLTADGSSQDITAVFSADPACTFTETGAYTAPADCTPSCNISAISATPSVCDPATNTYSVDVTVTYVNEPGSGTLNINGQIYTITGSPQTETITGLTADGSSQVITALFSADPTCTFTETGAYTAPADCTPGCNANPGTISQ